VNEPFALTPARIAAAIKRIHAGIDVLRDDLNAADRAVGDGDTGMTIANVVKAWLPTAETPPDCVGPMLQQLGRDTRRATGSSLGSVIAIGLTAAGKAAPDRPVDRLALVSMLDAAASAITQRSGASAGDKTVLDSLLAIRDAVARDADVLDAARGALVDFRNREARIGRARIYGAKSVGLDDPGMRAAALLLQSAWEPHHET
jgi:hypothetical protein